jgi:hypothetical protein
MTNRQQQFIEQFAHKYGLEIDRWEVDKAILASCCQRETGAQYIECAIPPDYPDSPVVSVHKSGGAVHNTTGPAWERYHRGEVYATMWFKDGLIHRDDGPALLLSDGTEVWYRNGKIYRDSGLPAIVCSDGTREYYRRGKKIRVENEQGVIWEKPRAKSKI